MLLWMCNLHTEKDMPQPFAFAVYHRDAQGNTKAILATQEFFWFRSSVPSSFSKISTGTWADGMCGSAIPQQTPVVVWHRQHIDFEPNPHTKGVDLYLIILMQYLILQKRNSYGPSMLAQKTLLPLIFLIILCECVAVGNIDSHGD